MSVGRLSTCTQRYALILASYSLEMGPTMTRSTPQHFFLVRYDSAPRNVACVLTLCDAKSAFCVAWCRGAVDKFFELNCMCNHLISQICSLGRRLFSYIMVKQSQKIYFIM